MSVIGGPNVIEDGLVLALDAANIKSFRGEPTENLVIDPLFSSGIWGRQWGSSNGSNSLVLTNDGREYGVRLNFNGTGNYGIYQSSNNTFTLSQGDILTVSFWARSNRNNSINYMYFMREGESNIGLPNRSVTTTWNYITLTYEYTSSISDQGTLMLACSSGWDEGDWVEFAYPQVEKKPYPTPFVDGTRGSTVATGGGWADRSGNGNHGELVNNPTFNSDNSGSLVFDGVDDYIQTSSFTPISNEFSVTSFVYPVTTSGGSDRDRYGGTLFSQDSSSSSDRYPLWLRVRGTEVSYSIWDSDPDGITTSGVNLSQNQWHYLAVIAQKGGVLKIFHGTTLIVSGTCPNQGNWTGDFYIGDLRAGRGIMFGGSVSTVCVYDRLLSDDEVLQNYNATKGRYGL